MDIKTKAKSAALKDLEHLMKNTEKRSLPGGKITPGDVDEVKVERKQKKTTFKAEHKPTGTPKHTAKPQHHDYPEGEEKEMTEAEPPEFDDEVEEKEESFHSDRSEPGDKDMMSDPKKVDAALKSFLVKTKKHKKSF